MLNLSLRFQSDFFIKYVLAKCVCAIVDVLSDPGYPVQVKPSGVNLAIGSPGRPLTSCIAQWRSAQSIPIRTSTTGLFAVRGKLIFLRWDHRWVHLLHSKTDIVPVTLVAVYAVTLCFTSPVTLSILYRLVSFRMFQPVHLKHLPLLSQFDPVVQALRLRQR